MWHDFVSFTVIVFLIIISIFRKNHKVPMQRGIRGGTGGKEGRGWGQKRRVAMGKSRQTERGGGSGVVGQERVGRDKGGCGQGEVV